MRPCGSPQHKQRFRGLVRSSPGELRSFWRRRAQVDLLHQISIARRRHNASNNFSCFQNGRSIIRSSAPTITTKQHARSTYNGSIAPGLAKASFDEFSIRQLRHLFVFHLKKTSKLFRDVNVCQNVFMWPRLWLPPSFFTHAKAQKMSLWEFWDPYDIPNKTKNDCDLINCVLEERAATTWSIAMLRVWLTAPGIAVRKHPLPQ